MLTKWARLIFEFLSRSDSNPAVLREAATICPWSELAEIVEIYLRSDVKEIDPLIATLRRQLEEAAEYEESRCIFLLFADLWAQVIHFHQQFPPTLQQQMLDRANEHAVLALIQV